MRTRRQAWLLALAGMAGLAMGCVKNVPQESNSGKDHRAKGAKTIKLEDGEARVRDIVTYPGGDRVDWKVVELPEGEMGKLQIKLKFKPARPGMDVAFNVYDEWFNRVGRAKPGDSKKKRVRLRNAKGKYYIQVYAPRRKDAVKYALALRFKKNDPVAQAADADLLAQIDDPPALPSVPKPPEPDPNAAGPGGPGGPGAVGLTPDPVEPVEPEQPAVAEVKAKVVKVQVASGGGVIVTLNRGSNAGVDRGWAGNVLQGSSGSPLDGGDFKIIKVTKRESVAKIKLTIDQIKANPKVRLTPP